MRTIQKTCLCILLHCLIDPPRSVLAALIAKVEFGQISSGLSNDRPQRPSDVTDRVLDTKVQMALYLRHTAGTGHGVYGDR